jgi:hypothetical protein
MRKTDHQEFMAYCRFRPPQQEAIMADNIGGVSAGAGTEN